MTIYDIKFLFLMKKIILFDRNPLYEKYILNDSNLKIYFIQEKTYSNYLINKISRIILYVKFFFFDKDFQYKISCEHSV